MNGVEAQGAETQEVPLPDVKTVEKWLVQDLKSAIGCLNAIYSDPDLCHQMAVFMHGRAQNARHADAIGKKPADVV